MMNVSLVLLVSTLAYLLAGIAFAATSCIDISNVASVTLQVSFPRDFEIDGQGTVYIADSLNNQVIRISYYGTGTRTE